MNNVRYVRCGHQQKSHVEVSDVHGDSHCQRTAQKSKHNCLTLSDLMGRASFQQALESKEFFDKLWHLVLNLRTGTGQKDGADCHLIRNHEACRRISAKRNWQQTLEHLSKILNWRTGLSAHRQSRAEAWKNVAAAGAKKFLKMDASDLPDVLRSGQVVLFISPLKPCEWKVGLVLSIWYTRGKKTLPTQMPMPFDKVRSVRICGMRPNESEAEGAFVADDSSLAVTCSPLRIAVVLRCDMQNPTADAFTCRLSSVSLQAVQAAHLMTWPKLLLTDDPMPCATFKMGSPSPKKKAGVKEPKDPKDPEEKKEKKGGMQTMLKAIGKEVSKEQEILVALLIYLVHFAFG